MRSVGKTAGNWKTEATSRIWFVDDGSSDRTWAVIQSFIASGFPVVGIKLSRNCEHDNALMAGLFTADGSAVVSIDADLQDDERAIDQMVDLHAKGNELVFGVRRDRSVDSLFKRGTARLFYWLMNALGAGVDSGSCRLPPDGSARHRGAQAVR